MTNEEDLLALAIPRMKAKWDSPKNVAKGDWYHMTDIEIRFRLMGEIGELRSELGAPGTPRTDVVIDWEAVVSEAIDVLAFALMGLDPERGLR